MAGKLITVKEYAERHGVAITTVRQKCVRGTIVGATKVGRDWLIPEDAPYIDHRIKDGSYRDWRNKKRVRRPVKETVTKQ